MKIRFQNPPISELVIATYFDPPLFGLRNEHVGLFWAKVRDEFPSVQQQQPVGGPAALGFTANDGALQPVSNDIFPMPRFWFVSHDQTHLIQLQKNALMFNWRKRETDYPQYAARLKPAFDRYYTLFEEFARDEGITPELKTGHCELTYINVIERCEYWNGPRDTAAIFPFIRIPELEPQSDGEVALSNTYNYMLGPNLHLRITVRTGETAERPGTPVLVFELSATGGLGQVAKSVVDAWFDQAHNAIVQCFVHIAGVDIQEKHWKRGGVGE